MKVWDHNACKAEIKSLRQQLAGAPAACDMDFSDAGHVTDCGCYDGD